MLSEIGAALWAATFGTRPLLISMLLVIAVCIIASGCEFLERRPLKGFAWAMAGAVLFGLAALVAQAETSSAPLGISPS